MVFIRVLAIRGQFPTQPRAPLRVIVRSGIDGLAALVAPGIILGAMLTGYTTATEAGVLACVYSILVGLLYRSLSWRKIWTALTDTVILTALIMMMIGFSTVTGWLMAIEQVPQQLAHAVLTNIQQPWLFLAAYLVFFLILGCVFDTLAAMIILMPILLPIVDQFGIDRIHFGLITVFVLMIGILTPPLGIALYILVDISGVSFQRITKATLPFLIPLIVALLLVTYIPEISLWLPNLVMGPE
jgi:tripartite ATP-independent transporter DctM subunit